MWISRVYTLMAYWQSLPIPDDLPPYVNFWAWNAHSDHLVFLLGLTFHNVFDTLTSRTSSWQIWEMRTLRSHWMSWMLPWSMFVIIIFIPHFSWFCKNQVVLYEEESEFCSANSCHNNPISCNWHVSVRLCLYLFHSSVNWLSRKNMNTLAVQQEDHHIFDFEYVLVPLLSENKLRYSLWLPMITDNTTLSQGLDDDNHP